MAVGLIFSVCGDKPRIKIEIQNKTPKEVLYRVPLSK